MATKNSGTVTDFITELETFFSDITLSVVPAVVVGDFNIHYDDPSKADKLIDLLDTIWFNSTCENSDTYTRTHPRPRDQSGC